MRDRICFNRDFNPRPRKGGDKRYETNDAEWRRFQSTPPQGGRLRDRLSIMGRVGISIHAPARGATLRGFLWKSGFYRFQSTPPQGGRPVQECFCHVRLYFNPRPRKGGDLLIRFPACEFCISIHAPARGATAKTDKFTAKAHIIFVYFCHIKQYIIYFTLFRRRCIENFPEFPVRVLQGFYVYRQFAPEIFTETRGLSCPRFLSRRCAPPYFCSCCPDSKTAGCPSSRQ